MADSTPGRMEILAIDRTKLAAERTLMSWLRTALSMISFGFTIYTFLHVLQDQSGVVILRPHAPRNFALALVGTGTIALVVACVQHKTFVRDLSCPSHPLRPWSLTFVVAWFIVLLGALTFAGIVLRAWPLG